jgi:hypothetical protein
LQLRVQTNCKNIVGYKTNKQGRCDCKKSMHNILFLQLFLCVSLQTQMLFFMIAKKKREQCVIVTILCVCDCNQNLYVVANLIVSVWLKLLVCFCYLWLQAWVVCDCNSGVIVTTKRKACTVFANYFVCDIANIAGYFYDCKKNLNSVCLQLFCVRDCNQKLSVVAPWLSLCDWSYLVIWLFMIANLSSVWLQ